MIRYLHKREECHLSLTCCIHLKHFELVNSTHNRCMNFLIVKKPFDFAVILSGMYVSNLFNILYEISNDILKTPGEYKGRDSSERRELFLDYCVSFVRTFYFENVCPLLK